MSEWFAGISFKLLIAFLLYRLKVIFERKEHEIGCELMDRLSFISVNFLQSTKECVNLKVIEEIVANWID